MADDGVAAYLRMRERFLSNPENQRIYEEKAAKSELWLQLVEARIAVGLTQDEVARRMGVTQSQVSRIEKAGYDAYTLNTLRRYAKALGEGFTIEANLHCPDGGIETPKEEQPETARSG